MACRKKVLAIMGLAVFALLAWKAPASANGFLYLTSSPENASVTIDGKSQGQTPVSVSLPAGRHSVEASLELYRSLAETVEVSEGEVTKVNFRLEKGSSWKQVPPLEFAPKGKGKITIITDWPTAEIYLDGYKIKETTPVTLRGISAGSHSLILINKGYAINRQFSLKKQGILTFRESFDQVRNNLYRLNLGDAGAALTAQETEKRRQALPAKIVVKLTTGQTLAEEKKPASVFWSERDIVSVAFQYRKSGAEAWESSELKLGDKEEDTFMIEKGTYEVQMVATHEKQPMGIWTSVIDSKNRNVGGSKVLFRKDFAADKLYAFDITYDGNTNLFYRVAEETLNTSVE
jgi:hypothetical protein